MDKEIQDHDDLAAHIGLLIDDCEKYSSEQKEVRERSLEYYNGEMKDLPAEDDFSSVVSKDLRKTVKKLMPSIMRTLLSNDRVVEYEPVSPEDEEQAKQATDYVNYVVVPQCGAEEAIYDAIFDAIVLKTGILKWTAYSRRKVAVQAYTDQPEESLIGLDQEDGIEVFDVVEKPETSQEVLQINPEAKRVDFKIKMMEEDTDIRLEAIPRGSFLIHPRSEGIADSPIVGERQTLTRSELVKRGYDPEVVRKLGLASRDEDSDDSLSRMGDDWTEKRQELTKAMQEIDVYEVYVQLDLDGDGIAELHRVVYCPNSVDDNDAEGGKVILEIEPVAEAPYAEVVIEREAHQFEGHSLSEDMIEIQRIKTSLLRNGLDNVYWQNMPMIFTDYGAMQNPEEIYKPKFGKPIVLKNGKKANEAFQPMTIPFMADKAFGFMDYLDQEAAETTGVTDQSGGLDPSAFQDMKAITAQIMQETGLAQAEMIIRSIARGGVKDAFKGILKLVVAHSDREKTVRMAGKWVTYDPRLWNVDMDCMVNVGLGAGSKERDLAVLQLLLNLQREIIASMGPDNPYVKPNQLYNTLARITEAAGFSSAEPYFSEPNQEEIMAKMQEMANKPDPNQQKVEAQMQIAQAQAEAKSQIEMAQMQADLQVKQAELEKDSQMEILKANLNKEIAILKGELDLLKHRENLALKYAQAGLQGPVDPMTQFSQGGLYNGQR